MQPQWLVAIGIALLAVQYLWCVSYWQDESALLLNVIHKSPTALAFGPLNAVALSQAAPPMFLLSLKCLVSVFGLSPYVTRLIPVLCGVASMALFPAVCRRLVSPSAVSWATALFVLSDNFIFESANVKPYSGDVLAVLLVVYAAFSAGHRAAPEVRLIRAALSAAVLIWFAYATLFAFAAVSLALLPQILPRHPLRYLFINLPPAASFLLVWRLAILPQRNPMLVHFWSDRMVDWSSPLHLPAWLIARLWELFLYTEHLPFGALLVFAAAVGLWNLGLTARPWVFRVLTLPFLLTIIASAAGQYPLGGGRVTMFLVPFELMWAGAGIAAMGKWSWLGSLLIAALLALDLYAVAVPRINGDSRAVISFLKSHREPDEPIYVMEGMGEDFLLAWPDAPGKIVLNVTSADQLPAAREWVAAAYKPRRGAGSLNAVLSRPDLKTITSFTVRGGQAALVDSKP